MRIGERGQVTIPKKLREKYGLEPHDEVAFLERRGELILQKSTVPQEDSRFRRWIGYLGRTGTSVDEFIEDIRGR
jgi:AbrB family looped-hinge helix DNA binding protein